MEKIKVSSSTTDRGWILTSIGMGNRIRMQQLQQQDWCEQQIREKQQKQEAIKQEDSEYDAQTIKFSEILKETQSEHNRMRH
jgi:hypothetical protein